MLAIVIVNWNLKEDTLACLDSLFQAYARPEKIILIDNGSTDGSVELFQERYGSAIHLLSNPTNLGYACGTNQGIQYAIDSGANWIFLLNNDTIVDIHLFNEMQKILDTGDQHSILAPVIYYYSRPDRIWYLGDRLIPGTLITQNQYHKKTLDPSLAEVIPVDFVNGCAMLVRREVFEAIGMFDESLVMYGEEVDFCWRARLAGYRCACATRAKIWHKVSLSANRLKPQTRYLRIRNQVHFYRKYSSGAHKLLMFFFTIVRSITIAVGDILRHQAELILPLWRGWYDGWRGA